MPFGILVASKIDVLIGCFPLFVLLDVKGRGCWWVAVVCGLTSPRLRNFYEKSYSLVMGFVVLTSVLEGILMQFHFPQEKLWASRFNATMGGFDGFIRFWFA